MNQGRSKLIHSSVYPPSWTGLSIVANDFAGGSYAPLEVRGGGAGYDLTKEDAVKIGVDILAFHAPELLAAAKEPVEQVLDTTVRVTAVGYESKTAILSNGIAVPITTFMGPGGTILQSHVGAVSFICGDEANGYRIEKPESFVNPQELAVGEEGLTHLSKVIAACLVVMEKRTHLYAKAGEDLKAAVIFLDNVKADLLDPAIATLHEPVPTHAPKTATYHDEVLDAAFEELPNEANYGRPGHGHAEEVKVKEASYGEVDDFIRNGRSNISKASGTLQGKIAQPQNFPKVGLAQTNGRFHSLTRGFDRPPQRGFDVVTEQPWDVMAKMGLEDPSSLPQK